MQKNKIYMTFRAVAALWLIFLLAFFLGIYVYSNKKWPYPLINEIELYVAGHSEEDTNLVEKVKNDLDIVPSRHIVRSPKKHLIPSTYNELAGLPLDSRRARPKLFLSATAPRGYRLIYGVFDFKKSVHGAVLFGPEGKVKNIWYTQQDNVDWNHRPDLNVFPHGIEIGRDGSIVTAFDGGTSLTKYDYCGNIVWRIKGEFHHSIAFDGESAVWTWGRPGADKGRYSTNFVKIDYQTGKVLDKFHVNDVLKANPDIDIFSILQIDSAEGSRWIKIGGGRWHVNDIEPLPERLAQYYPSFKAGDLLVSFRSPDLIFVMDPETYRVKWWRQGLTRRQHDPDWNDQGTITIFNNNMHRGYSSIYELNPRSFEYDKVVKGKKYEFYTWWRGTHQRLPQGGYLITSSNQGRVFEVDAQGDVTFEFINSYGEDEEGESFLSVSEARFFPLDFFKELPECDH